MDPVGVALALVGELFLAIETVKGNKEQCKALGTRAKHVVAELQRLPAITQASLGERGAFVALHESLRAAVDFCGEFCGRNIVRRMLTYRADAGRFDEFNHRLTEIVLDAGLALALDERAWRDAQTADTTQWDAMLQALEGGFSGVHAGVDQVAGSVEHVVGKVDNLTGQLAEMRALVESLRGQAVSAQAANGRTSGDPASGEDHVLQDAIMLQAVWEINPREIKYDLREDDSGLLAKIALGEGSFGEVHRGIFRSQSVAVKTIKFRAPGDEAEFMKEAITMSRLRHPHIVVFLGAKVVEKNKRGIMVLELLACSLHDAVYYPADHSVKWSDPLKHNMALQIAHGMAYLHTARPRIVHSDLKPANVMLTDRHICRIIDFGLSVVKESSRMVSNDPRIKAGNGTLHYQAPELLETGVGVKRDHKIDVYAYAVMIVELFQQQQPYPREMLARDIEAAVKRGERPAVNRDLVPADIVALVALAWHQIKERRPEFTSIVTSLTSSLAPSDHPGNKNAPAISALQRERERMAAEEAELAREIAEHDQRMKAARAKLELDRLQQEQEIARLAALQRPNTASTQPNAPVSPQSAAEGDVADIVRSMCDGSATVGVLTQSCKLLENLALDEAKKIEIVRLGGIKLVVDAMRKNPSNSDVQRFGCGLLQNLAVNSATHKVQISQLGGIECIMAAMQLHKDAVEVQKRGCGALESLAIENNNKLLIANHGGIPCIIAALQQHRGNKELQKKGCGALESLAMDSDVNKATIAQLGGIEAVLAAIRGFSDASDVLAKGLGALASFAVRSSANKISIGQLGGVECIIAAMRLFPSSVEIQRHGCGAFESLAIEAGNKAKIAQLGGIELLLAAMQAHRGHREIDRKSCGALESLAIDSDSNKAKIAQLGGLESILATLRQHANNADVLDKGFGAFESLAVRSEVNKVKLGELGAIDVLLNAMQLHKGLANIQRRVCGTLESLAIENGNKLKIAQLGGIEAVLVAMQQHQLNEEVQKKGCGALESLAVSSAANKARIGQAGGIECILLAMQQHKNSADTQKKEFGALESLALDASVKAKIVRLKGIEHITAAMNNHNGNQSLQDAGRALLEKLQK